MADKILHKRSLTTGSIPTTSSLLVGEIALNVPDGKIYIHKSGSQGQSIESAITSNSTSYIGILTLSGSLILSGSTDVNSGNVLDVATDNISFDFDSLAFSGSAEITGSLLVTGGITGSLSGNATTSTSSSFATSASFSQTASFVQTAQTASYVLNAVSSSFASTASFAQTAQTASYVLNAVSSSYSSFAISASYAVSASHEIIKEVSSSYADTASFAQSGDGIFSGSFSGSYEGDGSQLTGIFTDPFPFVGDAVITGSLTITGSFNAFKLNVNNVVLGPDAGTSLKAGGLNNVILGNSAASNLTTGDNNVIIGTNAGDGVGTGGNNVAIGRNAGFSALGNRSVLVGDQAGTEGGTDNVFLGYQAGAVGTGNYNVAIGTTALRGNSGGSNYSVAIGYEAGYRVGAGDDNILIGRNSGDLIVTGNANIIIGSGSQGASALERQLRIGHSDNIIISASLETGDIIFASTASAAYFVGDGSQLTGIVSSSYALTASYAETATPTLQQVTDQGASTTNTIVTSADITASRNISLPTNASFIRFNSAEIYGRVGGSYPGLHLASGQSANNRIWLCDLANTAGPVTMSFIGLGKISNIQTIESRANYPLIVRGGPAPNDSNDGLIFQTADASNVYQNRFEIESDTTTVDAYFTNINGLGINNPTPTAMLDVNGNINTTSHITASGNISASSFIGDGSEITGVVSSSYALTASHALNAGGGGAGFPFTGDAVITGSLVVSASATSQSLSVIGSGSTVFDVIGSVGTLFSVDDDLTGTLFSVNDISGFPVLQASASGDVFIGKSPQSLYTTAVISSTTAATTHSLCTLSTSSYDGAFFEYTAQSASNARAGNIMSTWNGSNIVYAETTTVDIGLTSDLTTEVIISGSTARLVAYGANAGYKIKTIIKAI
jgi:hypothetical protein